MLSSQEKKSKDRIPTPFASWRYPAVTAPKVAVQVQKEAFTTFLTHILPMHPRGFPSFHTPYVKGDPLSEPGDGAKETLPGVKKGWDVGVKKLG